MTSNVNFKFIFLAIVRLIFLMWLIQREKHHQKIYNHFSYPWRAATEKPLRRTFLLKGYEPHKKEENWCKDQQTISQSIKPFVFIFAAVVLLGLKNACHLNGPLVNHLVANGDSFTSRQCAFCLFIDRRTFLFCCWRQSFSVVAMCRILRRDIVNTAKCRARILCPADLMAPRTKLLFFILAVYLVKTMSRHNLLSAHSKFQGADYSSRIKPDGEGDVYANAGFVLVSNPIRLKWIFSWKE